MACEVTIIISFLLPDLLFPMGLKDLLQCLRDVVPEWFELGVQLSVPPSKLKTIECDNSNDVAKCKRLMLQEWVKNPGRKPSWCSLTDALLQLGKNVLADGIAQKFSK